MKTFFLIPLAIFFISEYVKADCLPPNLAKSYQICVLRIPEEDIQYDSQKNATMPESFRCFSKCILEHADYFKNGTFTMNSLFKHIEDTFTHKDSGNYIIMKEFSYIEEANKFDDDCDKAEKYIELKMQAVFNDHKFNVPYCSES